VHHEAKLQVLPLADAVGDDGVGFGLLVVGLGEGGHANQAQQHGEKALFHGKSVLSRKSRKNGWIFL
jgi:hypothetical protein